MYVRLAIVLCTRSPPAKKVLKPLLFCPEKPTRDKTTPKQEARKSQSVRGRRGRTRRNPLPGASILWAGLAPQTLANTL